MEEVHTCEMDQQRRETKSKTQVTGKIFSQSTSNIKQYRHFSRVTTKYQHTLYINQYQPILTCAMDQLLKQTRSKTQVSGIFSRFPSNNTRFYRFANDVWDASTDVWDGPTAQTNRKQNESSKEEFFIVYIKQY